MYIQKWCDPSMECSYGYTIFFYSIFHAKCFMRERKGFWESGRKEAGERRGERRKEVMKARKERKNKRKKI